MLVHLCLVHLVICQRLRFIWFQALERGCVCVYACVWVWERHWSQTEPDINRSHAMNKLTRKFLDLVSLSLKQKRFCENENEGNSCNMLTTMPRELSKYLTFLALDFLLPSSSFPVGDELCVASPSTLTCETKVWFSAYWMRVNSTTTNGQKSQVHIMQYVERAYHIPP